MAAALIGNVIVSNVSANISTQTITGKKGNGKKQDLANNISVEPSLGTGNYTYKWVKVSGKPITISDDVAKSINVIYDSLSESGSSNVYCIVTDNGTGVQITTRNCVLNWTDLTTPITSVSWITPDSTYDGSSKLITVESTVPPEAGENYTITTTSATNAGEIASTTITGTELYTGTHTSPPLTIAKAVITITSNDALITYGSSVPTFDHTPTGFVNDEDASVITGLVTHSTTATSTSNVGSYTITPTISGLSATNYTFLASTGTLTINKAVITITTSNASMTYGSSLPLFGYTPTGFVNSETASVITGTVSHSTTGTSTSTVGSYTITPTISGLTATNYSFSAVNGTLTINKAVLTITTSNASMTYGSSLPTFAYTPTGFVNSETASVITGTVTHTTAGSSTSSVGSYTITPTISGLTATNYSFSAVNGTLTISKAVITITTSNASMTYGSSVPTSLFGYSLSGLLNGDTSNVVTGLNGISVGSAAHSTTATSSSNVGTYPIATNISGLSATNYSFTAANGTLTISKAVITITTSNASMTYGSSLPLFGYTPTGFVNSETASVITGTVSHSTTGTSTSTVGSYTITPTISGLTATNYSFSAVNGTLTINKAVLTITTSNASMTYGSSLPTFAYTPTGFVNSETASVITGTVTHTTAGSSTSSVGSYTITPVVSGLTATNYSFTPANGTLTISKAVLTITVNNATISYGSSFPTFTYTISGFKGSDSASAISLTVGYSVSGGPTYNAGSYSIVPSVTSFTATNYTFTTVYGTLTITRPLTASIVTGSATFNGDPQSFTIDQINGTYTGSTSVSGTNAGTYTTTIYGTGYYTGSVTGTLTISPATITLQAPLGYASVPSVAYDGTTKSVGYTVGGTARNNNSYTISSTSGINPGVYTSTITSTTTNYVVSSTYNSFTWYITTPLTASNKTGSATYNGSSQSFTITGINGTYSGSPTVSGTGVEVYTTTIYGTTFYTGSVTGTLTINQAQLTATNTTSPHTFYNRQQQSFSISGINAPSGSYFGSPTVYGTNAGSYTTRIFGTGNYTGYVDGTLTIYQDVGYVDIFYGGVHDASRTTSVIVPVRTSNAAFTVTHSVSGDGAADAEHTSFGYGGPYNWNQSYEPVPPGAVVRNKNPQTLGFVVTITARTNDSNYGVWTSETTVTFNAAPPPSGGTTANE